MNKIRNLTNQTFNHLTAIKYIGSDNNKKAIWLFKCDCGKEKILRGTNVTSGRIKSCSCLKRKRLIKRQLKEMMEKLEINRNA